MHSRLTLRNSLIAAFRTAVFACLLVGIAHAQNPTQTIESWRGQITDEQGSTISGAEVVLLNANGKEQTATTDLNGEFAFKNLVAGPYTVIVTAPNFQPLRQTDVSLSVNSAPFKATLLVAAVSEEQQVVAEINGVSVEPDQNLSATIIEGQELQDLLPDNEEDLREFLQQLAGPAASGQGGAQITVNGFRGGRVPPKEAIASVRVNSNPFSAEYALSGAARVELITKPGNDQWHGSSSWTARNSALDARNAFALVKPAVAQNRYGFNLSGPLVRKRLSFFASTDYRNLNGSSTIVATTLDGPFTANVPAPNSNRGLDLRVDYLLSKRNTLSVNYNLGQSRTINREFTVRFEGGRGVSTFILPERGSDAFSQGHTLRFAETFIINAKLLLETRLQLEYGRTRAAANTNGVAINVAGAFLGGGAVCCPSRNTTSGGEWQQYLTWSRKTHTMRGGWQQEYDRVDDYSATNFNGTYTFANLTQYRDALAGLGRAQQFSLNRGNPQLNYSMWRSAWFINDDWRLNNRLTVSLGLRHEFQTQLGDANNFAPRLGIALSPGKGRKTVFRFGGGIFYNRLLGNLYENTLRFNGVRQTSIVIANAQYPDPFAGNPVIQTQTRNTIRRTLDPALHAPQTISFSTSLERQLPLGLTTSTTYTFSRGLHQFRTRNLNAPRNGEFPLGLATGALYQIESSATSRHHSMLTRMERRFNRSFSIFGNYTLAWTKSDADSAIALPANSYDLRSEWARAFTDRRHTLFLSGRVRLPWEFNLSPTLTASSGAPFNITSGFDENGDTSFTDRPAGLHRNQSLSANRYAQLPNLTRCVLNCKPTDTGPISLADFLNRYHPNGVRAEGPGAFLASLRLAKSFSFGKRIVTANERTTRRAERGRDPKPRATTNADRESGRFTLQFSVQVSNLFNRVNFGQFGGVLGSPYFGLPSSAGGARGFEFTTRFSF